MQTQPGAEMISVRNVPTGLWFESLTAADGAILNDTWPLVSLPHFLSLCLSLLLGLLPVYHDMRTPCSCCYDFGNAIPTMITWNPP